MCKTVALGLLLIAYIGITDAVETAKRSTIYVQQKDSFDVMCATVMLS